MRLRGLESKRLLTRAALLLRGLFADLKADEATDRDLVTELLADAADVLFDGDFGVAFDEALVDQTMGLVELLEFAFDDFGDGLRRLVFDLFGGNFPFLFQDFRIDFVAVHVERAAGGDLQGDVAHELFELVGGDGGFFACADFDQHADFCAGVDVCSDHAVAADFVADEARKLDVFAGLGDSRDTVGFERFESGSASQFLGDLVTECFETFVARDKVGFAIDFSQDADFGAGLDELGDQAVFGVTRCFFSSGGDTFFAEEIDGGFNVAGGFDQCLFAFHQTCAGDFAQFAHACSTNFAHDSKF
jgi:hypothetical protein